MPACFLRAITLQGNYVNAITHLPCSQGCAGLMLMDVSHRGDRALLSPCHLTPLDLRLPRWGGRAVMLMTVGSSCPPECCQDGITQTHTHGHTHTLIIQRTPNRTDTHMQITQRDMASHSPKDNDDTSVHSNVGTHINTLFTHTEITENTL